MGRIDSNEIGNEIQQCIYEAINLKDRIDTIYPLEEKRPGYIDQAVDHLIEAIGNLENLAIDLEE